MRARLTQTELMVAAYVGSGRNVQAITRGWSPHTAPPTNPWTRHIEGAAGEMATAKALGVYWEPIIGDPDADDVGRYQVRTNISRKHQDTCLRPRDKPNRVYISVLSFCPDFELIGWITGADGKREEWLRPGDPERPPCFYVPRKALHPMEELPPSGVVAAPDNQDVIEEMMEFAREVLK